MTEADSFVCPPSMLDDANDIFSGTEYDVPLNFNGAPPRVLDLGANCGAFAVWAGMRWPGAIIACYEPNPEALRYLRENVAPTVKVIEAAVTSKVGTVKLYEGAKNLGMAGLEALPWGDPSVKGDGVAVSTVHPSKLPLADIIKIDTEGSELDILTHYDLSETSAVMYEYHRREDRRPLEDLLEAQGFFLVGGHIRNPWLGTMRWLRETEPT